VFDTLATLTAGMVSRKVKEEGMRYWLVVGLPKNWDIAFEHGSIWGGAKKRLDSQRGTCYVGGGKDR